MSIDDPNYFNPKINKARLRNKIYNYLAKYLLAKFLCLICCDDWVYSTARLGYRYCKRKNCDKTQKRVTTPLWKGYVVEKWIKIKFHNNRF